MKEKPILFSTPMVQAILEGRKTQTRRIMKDQPDCSLLPCGTSNQYWADNPENLKAKYFRCKYGIEDILWVRETFFAGYPLDENDCIIEGSELQYWYYADGRYARPFDMSDSMCIHLYGLQNKDMWPKWKPSIFMPKEACRIKLEITNIRVERLQDISEEDAIKEGILMNNIPHEGWYWMENVYNTDSSVIAYEKLWEKINGKGSWNLNPWVWVIEFKRINF